MPNDLSSTEAFDSWYRYAHPKVLAALCALCGDAEVARDATDEAFSRCYVSWPRVRAMESPLGWVVRVAQNAMRRTMRRRALEQRLLHRGRLPEEMLEPSFLDARELLERLSPRQRTAMVLRYIVDLPEAEVASVMRISRGTVASTLFDARRRLATDVGGTTNKETRTDV